MDVIKLFYEMRGIRNLIKPQLHMTVVKSKPTYTIETILKNHNSRNLISIIPHDTMEFKNPDNILYEFCHIDGSGILAYFIFDYMVDKLDKDYLKYVVKNSRAVNLCGVDDFNLSPN